MLSLITTHSCSGEADDGLLFVAVVLQRLGVDPLLVVDGAVPLDDTGAHGAGAVQVPGSVKTDVAETWNGKQLVRKEE